MLLLLAIVAGVSAGLRSMTPLAVTAWAAQSWPAVQQSGLAFMAAPAAAYVLTMLAVGELITDKLPFVPSRLTPGPLIVRTVSGALCGAVFAAAAPQPMIVPALAGAIGGIAGSYGGHAARRHFSVIRKLPDLAVALAEDAVAIALALFAVSRI